MGIWPLYAPVAKRNPVSSTAAEVSSTLKPWGSKIWYTWRPVSSSQTCRKEQKNQIIHIPFGSYENLTVFKTASEWVLCSSKIFSNILPWMLVWSKKVLKDAVPSSHSCGILERVRGTLRWPRQAATILGSLGCGGSSQFCYCEHEARVVAR